jgi:hypothetical protein
MMVLNKYLIVLSIFLLSSCAGGIKPVEITNTPLQPTITQPSNPTPITMLPIHWKIINQDGNIYYGLTVKDYEALALNMEEIKRYLLAQKNIIKYYKAVTAN